MSEMWRQAEAIAAAARSRGAADAEVLIVENHIVRYELGWDRASERDESRVSLRVFAADGRSGVAEAELGKGSLDALIGAALRGGGPVRRAAPRLDVPDRGLGVLDARYTQLDERPSPDGVRMGEARAVRIQLCKHVLFGFQNSSFPLRI